MMAANLKFPTPRVVESYTPVAVNDALFQGRCSSSSKRRCCCGKFLLVVVVAHGM